MSQSSSSSSSRRFDSDSDSDSDASTNTPLDSVPGAPDSNSSDLNTPATPRRLLSPRERFAPDRVEDLATDSSLEEKEAEITADAPTSARLDEEMARRHVPPRERRRHERARIQREKREQKRRLAQGHSQGHARHSHHSVSDAARLRAERDFALGARENPPPAPPKPRGFPKFLKRICALVAVIFVGQLAFAAFTAPQFEIASVEIIGLAATPQEAVRPLARRLLGQNLLRVNRASVEKAVRLVPTIADAKVVRLVNWPPKVALQVTERQPLLKVGAGQNWWVVDQNGVAFRRPNAGDGALYSVVAPQFSPDLKQTLQPKTWIQARALNTAIRRDNDLAEENTASEIVQNSQKPPFWKLRRIYFDKDGLASLRVTRAPHREMLVRLGDDAWPEKLARARVTLAYFERTGRRAAELDLVSLERPVWTPIVAQTEAEKAPKAG